MYKGILRLFGLTLVAALVLPVAVSSYDSFQRNKTHTYLPAPSPVVVTRLASLPSKL